MICRTYSKKIVCFLSILSLFLCTSCGKSSDSEESLRDQYSEAIENREFDKARSLAEKADRLNWRGGHVKFVNEKEIYYLLADNSRNNADRIFYMFNSIEPSQMPDMTDVLKVAASQSNEYLALKLIKGGVRPNAAVINAAVINELNDLLLVLLQKDISYLKNENLISYARDCQSLREYVERYEFELKEKELKRFNEKVMELLSSSVSTRPATGLVKSDSYGDIPKEYITYNKEAEIYNEKANKLVLLALGLNQKAEARKIMSSMKSTLEWKVLGDWAHIVEHQPQYNSVYNAYQVSESREEIEKTKILLETSDLN